MLQTSTVYTYSLSEARTLQRRPDFIALILKFNFLLSGFRTFHEVPAGGISFLINSS